MTLAQIIAGVGYVVFALVVAHVQWVATLIATGNFSAIDSKVVARWCYKRYRVRIIGNSDVVIVQHRVIGKWLDHNVLQVNQTYDKYDPLVKRNVKVTCMEAALQVARDLYMDTHYSLGRVINGGLASGVVVYTIGDDQ